VSVTQLAASPFSSEGASNGSLTASAGSAAALSRPRPRPRPRPRTAGASPCTGRDGPRPLLQLHRCLAQHCRPHRCTPAAAIFAVPLGSHTRASSSRAYPSCFSGGQ
jgi:hypothetical protein